MNAFVFNRSHNKEGGLSRVASKSVWTWPAWVLKLLYESRIKLRQIVAQVFIEAFVLGYLKPIRTFQTTPSVSFYRVLERLYCLFR